MLHDQDGQRKIRRKLRNDRTERRRAAGGDTDRQYLRLARPANRNRRADGQASALPPGRLA